MSKENLANRLKCARERVKITQSELARRVGISPQAIQALESGTSAGSRHLASIAGALGVEALWLSDGKGNMVRTPRPDISYPSDGISPGNLGMVLGLNDVEHGFPPVRLTYHEDTVPIFICESISRARMPKRSINEIQSENLSWISAENPSIFEIIPDELQRIADSGFMYATGSKPDDYTRRPHYLDGQVDAYAIYINDYVHISYQNINHSVAFISPHKRPDFGDHVIVWHENNTFVSGTLFEETPESISLNFEVINDLVFDGRWGDRLLDVAPAVKFSKDHIRSVHVVLGLEFVKPRSPQISLRSPFYRNDDIQTDL